VAGAPISAFLIGGDTAPERLREAQESGHHMLHKPVSPRKLRAMVTQLPAGTFLMFNDRPERRSRWRWWTKCRRSAAAKAAFPAP